IYGDTTVDGYANAVVVSVSSEIGRKNDRRRSALVGVETYHERIKTTRASVLRSIAERKIVGARHARDPGSSIRIDCNTLRIAEARAADVCRIEQRIARWIQFRQKSIVTACVDRLECVPCWKIRGVRCS